MKKISKFFKKRGLHETIGHNAFVLAILNEHPHMFKRLINHAVKSEETKIQLIDSIAVCGEDLTYLAEQHLPGNTEIHELLKLAGVDRDKAKLDEYNPFNAVIDAVNNPRTHTENLSSYIASNQYEVVLKELNFRRDCIWHRDLNSCGMNKDDIILMTNKDGMNLRWIQAISAIFCPV